MFSHRKFLLSFLRSQRILRGSAAEQDAEFRGNPSYIFTPSAGDFCLHSVHESYAYVGGTPDNPNVMDKEAGMMALDAFLSLFDMTRDPRWLTAATQAAHYSETWVYCWGIPASLAWVRSRSLAALPGRCTARAAAAPAERLRRNAQFAKTHGF